MTLSNGHDVFPALWKWFGSSLMSWSHHSANYFQNTILFSVFIYETLGRRHPSLQAQEEGEEQMQQRQIFSKALMRWTILTQTQSKDDTG